MPDQELKELIFNPKKYIESFISIPNKSRLSVPFKFNSVQGKLYSGFSRRNIILKAAQLGMTSLIMALYLHNTITRPYTTSIVIAHEEFITQRLLSKAKVFEASIPEEMKPVMHRSSTYELSWNEINSVFYISSARSFVFGRGERIDNALLSEFAFWSEPEEKFKGMIARIPTEGTLTIETTPNGEGNYFHQLWLEAKEGEKTGRSLYKPFFFPWWECNDYSLPADSESALPIDRQSPLTYTDEELPLVRTHKLTEDQIRWRRAMVSELGVLFYQEYPENEATCFLQYSDSVFDSQLLVEKSRECYPAPDSYENASVWFKPQLGGIYIIGADPTVGQVNKAAATVWDIRDCKLCATLTGMYEPQIFALKLKELGRYYNNACLAVESNNPGITVLSYLQDYNNLWYQRDLISGKLTNKPGWLTTRASKPYMIQHFKTLLPELDIRDINLIIESRNLRYVGLEAVSNTEDDILMSSMIAIACKDSMPTVKRGLVGTAGWKKW